MKISKLLPISLLAAFALAGCSGTGPASFKNLEAEEILDTSEANIVFAKVGLATLAASNVDATMSLKQVTSQTTGEMDMTGNYVFYKDGGYKSTNNLKTKTVQDGLTLQKEAKTETYCGKYDDKNYFLTSEVSGSETRYQEQIVPTEDGSVFKQEVVIGLMDTLKAQASQVAKRKDGTYYLFNSSVNEQYIAVEFGANITREEHRIQKVQAVAELNNDFSVKSFEMYASQETNIDPESLEVYAQPKLITEQKMTFGFAYKDLADAGDEITSRAALIKEKPQLAAARLNVNKYLYDAETKEISEVDTAYEIIDFERLSHNTYHAALALQFDVTTTCNAFDVELEYTTVTGLLEPGTAKSKVLSASNVSNVVNQLVVVDADKGVLYDKGGVEYFTLLIQFDLAINESGEAVLSNIDYIALPTALM